jgi:transcriptional regulator with XRE-family HTH domain
MAKKTPNATDVFVGQRVRMARLMANMSQEKLAAPLGLTFQQVQKYEKGSNRIGASRMQQIAHILQKPVAWFFDQEGVARDETGALHKMLTTPGGVKLAEAFVAIADNDRRHTVIDVACALATAERDIATAEARANVGRAA